MTQRVSIVKNDDVAQKCPFKKFGHQTLCPHLVWIMINESPQRGFNQGQLTPIDACFELPALHVLMGF